MATKKRKPPIKKNTSSKKRQVPTATKSAKTATQPAMPKKLSSVIGLSRQSMGLLWRNKKVFSGIIGIYFLLNLIFANGSLLGLDIAELKQGFTNQFIGSLSAYVVAVASLGSVATESAAVYQSFFALFTSLVLIWTLRQLYAGAQFRIRDAYYKAMYPVVPFVLVILFVCLLLAPMIIGTSLYQILLQSGIASQTYEIVIFLIVALFLTLLSLYLITRSLFALIIVTLPDMTPLPALRLAKRLVAGRQGTVMRKLLFLPVLLLLVTVVSLLPFIVLLPVVAPLIMLLISPILFTIAHSYIYALYRELMGD